MPRRNRLSTGTYALAVGAPHILAIVCAILTVHPSLAAACDRALANAYEQKARDAGDNYARKVRYYRNAIDVCPKTPITYADLSDALLHLNNIGEAESVIKRGVKVDPRHSEVRRVYGDVLRRKKEFSAAVEQYEKALQYAQIPRDRFYALAHRGWAQHRLGKIAESTRSWTDALDVNIVFDPVTNRKLYNMVAWNYAVCRTHEICDGAAAVEFYEMNPARNPTWYELGTGAAAYARSGDFAAAVRLQAASISMIESTDMPDREKWLRGARDRMRLFKEEIPYTEN